VIIEIEPERFRVIGGETGRSGAEHFQALIDRGLRAQLQSQSMLTGKLMIEIDFHPDKPVKLVGGSSKYPEMPTVLTAFQEISKTLQEIPLEEIAHRVAGSLAGIEKMVNSPEAREATKALQETLQETAALVRGLNEKLDPLAASIEETLQDTRNLLRNTDKRVGSLASGLGKAVGDTRKLIRNADGQVTQVASSVDETVRDAQKVVRSVDGWVAPAADTFVSTSKAARAVLARAESTLGTVEGMTSESSSLRFEFTTALREISASARSLRILAEYLEQHPDALLRGKGGLGGN
jgi:paraquat-inducible protein B